MSSAFGPAAPTRLDPLGAVICYLSVTRAVEKGTVHLPSSEDVCDALTSGKAGRNGDWRPDIDRIRKDLVWLHEHCLLFDQTARTTEESMKTLSLRRVDERIRNFRPSYCRVEGKRRRFDSAAIVDRPVSAARLIALKDLFRFNEEGLPHELLSKFLHSEELVRDDSEFCDFIERMLSIEYVQTDPKTLSFRLSHSSQRFIIEPGIVFRCQDIYVELLGLDHLQEKPIDHPQEQPAEKDQRRARRIARLKRAGDFARRLR